MPTPFTKEWEIDGRSVRRAIEHHVAHGCDGVMLAGTCGEGPWLRDSQLESLVKNAADQSSGRLRIGAQATDNSPGQILDRLEALAGWGVEFGVVAQPFFFNNATSTRLRDFYLEIFERSPLPVFFYDRGRASSTPVPLEILGEIISHPRVIGVKDSAGEAERWTVVSAVRRSRPELLVLTGNEFTLLDALRDGYDGAFVGGGILTAGIIRSILERFAAGAEEAAAALDARAKEALFAIYGGPKITCWLAGEKYALMRLGIFSHWHNIPGYPLTESCRTAIDETVESAEWLRPGAPVREVS